MDTQKPKRIEWVDVAKAVGILLVVYGHVLLGAHDAGLWSDTLNYRIQHSVIYTTHMPLFFFLSGIFAVKWGKRAAKTAVWQKIRTLIIPYFIWGIFQAVVMQAVAKNTNNGQGLSNAFTLPWMPYAQFWFLYDLFWIFLIYYLAVNVMKMGKKVLFVFSFILFLLSPWLHTWEVWRIFYHLIFFVAGTFVLEQQDQLNQIKLLPSFIAAVILNVVYFMLPANQELTTFVSFFVAMSGIAFLINLSKLLKHSWIDFVGRNSMAIYVLHIIFTAGSRVFLMKLGLTALPFVLTVGLLAGMIGPLIIFVILKKMKINQYLF
ncbi:acyltransferase [Fructobacillus sp. W13]|uniref:Acyltransferase n=1 Tax=Fructobacillus apis TaxID=2935017 RepID=A0ABT0ZNV7_9LACO|nr:acyltransferase [Fructobacillus apis]MCO0831687.1 acyltransferase [Fructobacillus apis]